LTAELAAQAPSAKVTCADRKAAAPTAA
jgi:hypothetical protein